MTITTKTTTGEKIAALRKAAGYTQLSLARRSGVQAPHISMIERGLRNPTARTLQKLAMGFGCEPSDLSAERTEDYAA